MSEPASIAGDVQVKTLDDLLPYLMNRAVSRLNQNLAEELRRRRLTFAHWRVLAVLHADDGRTVGELAELTVIPQSTLSRLLERMERAQLLERRPHAQDSRRVTAWLTARGRDAYGRILPLALAEHRKAVEGLSPEEMTQVIATVRLMLRNLGIAALPGGG